MCATLSHWNKFRNQNNCTGLYFIVPFKDDVIVYYKVRQPSKGVIQMKEYEKNKTEIPVWEKLNLTVEEAAAYSGIGINKIYAMTNTPNCPFVLYIGNKRLLKRKAFERFINSKVAI